jgi:signal transduction histidine kinase
MADVLPAEFYAGGLERLERIILSARGIGTFAENVRRALDEERTLRDLASTAISEVFSRAFNGARDYFLTNEDCEGQREGARQRFQITGAELTTRVAHHVTGSVDAHVETSPAVLQTVFEEIIRNSFGWKAITLTCDIRIDTSGWVRLEIADDGEGYKPEVLGREYATAIPTGGISLIELYVERILKGRAVKRQNLAPGGAVVSFELPPERTRG